MAVDMTDETIAQYMERIEKMSIKEIQKEIEFLETPGYNCEGLVCADGVITPRTKMHRKVLWYKRMNQKSLTALQWAKEGYEYNAIRDAVQYVTNKHDFGYFIQPWKDEFLRMPFDVTKRKKWADYVAECHATGKEIDYDNYDWDK